MPTAARLTAAILFAIVGYFIFTAMVPSFGDDVIPRYLLPLSIGTGLWSGWVLCGPNAHGVRSGVGTGFTAIVGMVFLIMFILSFVQMIQLSLRRRYDGPMEAIVDVFTLMYENVMMFATPEMGVTLLAGGFIAGFLTGVMGKRYPR
uniref:TrgA family protein n=1 Tax=Yoonia sp. TaxID=2212373 RepID=UPI00404857D8|tara:strand:+ start:65516 stop:65956 length:441 start_codon:yes stop_codon:yes gene_type:complete